MTSKAPTLEVLESRLLYSADVFGLTDIDAVGFDDTVVKPFGTDDGSTIDLRFDVSHGGLRVIDDFDSEVNLDGWILRDMPAHGQFLLNGTPLGQDDVVTETEVLTGQLQYQHDGSGDLVDTSRFQHSFAGNSNNSWVRVHLDIAQPNTPAVLIPDAVTYTGNSATVNTTTLLSNDSDPDGDTLVITGFDQPLNGTLELIAEGELEYTDTSGITNANLLDTAAVTVRELDSSYVFAAPLVTSTDELTGIGAPIDGVATLQEDGSGAAFTTAENGLDYGAFNLPSQFEIEIEVNADTYTTTHSSIIYSLGAVADAGSVTVYTDYIGGDPYLIAHMGLPGGTAYLPNNSIDLFFSDSLLFHELDASYLSGWHTITLTVDEDELASLSLDGVIVDQLDASGASYGGSDFRVGNDIYSASINRPFDGTLRNLYVRDLYGLGTDSPAVNDADSSVSFFRFNDTQSVAVDDNYTLETDGTVSSATLGVDSLGVNDTLNTSATVSHSWSLADQANYGTAVVNPDGSFNYYQTNPTQTSDSFEYTLTSSYTDGSVVLWTNVSEGTVTLDASNVAVGTAPTANADSLSVFEGGAVSQTVAGNASLFANDTDIENDDFDLASFSNPVYGSLSLQTDGTFSYTHDGSENFTDSFTYSVVDEYNNVSAPTTVSINILPVNDNSPVVATGSLYIELGGTQDTLDGGSTSVLSLATDDDVGDTLTASYITSSGWIDVDINPDGTFLVYDDLPQRTDPASFIFEVSDAAGNTERSEVFVTIGPNYAPVAVNDTLSVVEGGTITSTATGETSLFDNDTDQNNQSLSLNSFTPPSHGSVSINNDGTFSYTHDGSENFSDQFSYIIEDEFNETSAAPATVFITITPDNDYVPVAVADSLTVDFDQSTSVLDSGATSLLANDIDGDTGDILSASLINDASKGTVSLNADGTFSYQHLQSAGSGSDSFRYRVTDDAGQWSEVDVLVSILANNSPIAFDDALTVDEGASVAVTDNGNASLLFNDSDPDGDAVSVSNGSIPLNGTMNVLPDGSFTYTHDGSETLYDEFRYNIVDEHGEQSASLGVVRITINPVNDNAPVVGDDQIQLEFGEQQNQLVGGQITLLHNDTDADASDTFTASLATAPSKGNVTINPDGTFEYRHDGVQSGADSFSYTVIDSGGNSTTGTVNVEIGEENKPPVFLGGNREIQFHEGVADSSDLSSYFSDDGDLSYEIRSGDESFFELNTATGELEINASTADVGTHSIVVRVTDDAGQSVQRRFEIVVLANDTSGGNTTTTTTTQTTTPDTTPESETEDEVTPGTLETEAEEEPESPQTAESESSDTSDAIAGELLALWGHVGSANGSDGRVDVDVDGLLGDAAGASRESLLGGGSNQSVLRIGAVDGLSLSNLLDSANVPESAALVDATRGSQSSLTEVEGARNITPAVTTATAATGFSLGYLLWLARSGFLLSTVLSALPAWRNVDPLPVLGSLSDTASKDDDPEDKSLSELTERD